MAAPRIHLFIRWPEPGRAYTRLIPRLGADGAARLHRRLTERTLGVMRDTGLAMTLRTTGAPPARFAGWLGNDFQIEDQGDGSLGERLACVPAPAILLGADLPGLEAHHLLTAAAALEEVPAAIGPAEDGGYWCLALVRPAPFLFDQMEWGTDRVARETRSRLDAQGWSYHMLTELADCDRPEDLDRFPELLA